MSDVIMQYRAMLDGSQFASEAGKMNSHLHQMGISTGTATANLGPLGTILGTLANPMTAVALGITAIGAAFVGSIQSAAAFETAMSGAKKVISLDSGTNADEYFSKLGAGLQELSTRAPVAANDLAALAAVGGSLGVSSDAILGFAESAAQMSVAFELPAEEAATAAAKILNAFGQPIDTANMQALGNVMNQIGDSMAATESEVLDFTNRASFLNTTMGLSVAQVATLGGTLISTGLTAEVAASGIKSALNTLTSESSKTGGMDNWAKLMGTSVDELKTKIAGDLPNTLIETANKIADIEDPVLRFQTAVAMAGSEGAVALLKLAGQQDVYNSALEETIAQWDKGQKGESGGMAKTFEANSDTFNAQMQIVSNAVTYASVAVGNVFLPALTSAASGLSSFIVGAVQVGQALGSIVTGSQYFAAVSNAATNMGNVVKAVVTNFTALWGPAWDALGGGSTAMGALSIAFNVLTLPITLLWTAISSVVGIFASLLTAMQPVAEFMGNVLGTAISTASTYLQAFVEVITETVTKSSTFQAIVTAIESVQEGISSAVDTIKGYFSDMFSGIDPTGPLGNLLNSVIDTIKNSELGQFITKVAGEGFFGEVADRAAQIDQAKQLAAEEGEAAAQARRDAEQEATKRQQNADEAIKLAEAAEQGKKEGEAKADAYVEAYGSGMDAGMQMLNGKWVSQQQGRGTYGGMFGRDAGTTTTKLDSGLELELQYINDKAGTKASLWIDGQKVSETSAGLSAGASEADIINGLLKDAGIIGAKEGNILELSGDTAQAAILKQKLQIEFDYTGIEEFGAQFKSRLENEGQVIATEGSKAAQDTYSSLLDNFREPAVEKLGEVLDEVNKLAAERPLAASEYQLFGQTYKEHLLDNITQMKPYLEDEMADLAKKGTDAFSDHSFSDEERADMLGMKPWLEALKEKSPEEFAKAGGDSWLAFIKAIESGASSGELEKIFSELSEKIAKTTLTTFGTSTAKKFDLAAWLKNPDRTLVADWQDFAKNVFQPALIDATTTSLKDLNLGLGDGYRAGKDLLEAFKAVAAVMPELFTGEQLMALQKYNGSLDGTKTTLEAMSVKIDKSNSNLKEFKETIELCEPLSEDLFAQWQEGETSGAFFESYVGASYGTNFENYLKKLSEQYASTADSAQRLNDAHNGIYTAPGTDLTLDIDTVQAGQNLDGITTTLDGILEKTKTPMYLSIGSVAPEGTTTDLEKIKSDITSIQKSVKLTVDIDRVNFDTLLKDIAAAHSMPVTVDVSANAGQIRALVDAAISEALAAM